MKVSELREGMLIRPKAGMIWHAFRSGLVVYLDKDRHLHGAGTFMGQDVAMYITKMGYTKRHTTPGMENTMGARIVMMKGRLMAVDQYSWSRIRPVDESR